MSTVAEQLRQAREAKNLTVQQVVEITKIRTDHLRALEEGNFDVFSAPVYIRGFVRSYANLAQAGRAANHGGAGNGAGGHHEVRRAATAGRAPAQRGRFPHAAALEGGLAEGVDRIGRRNRTGGRGLGLGRLAAS